MRSKVLAIFLSIIAVIVLVVVVMLATAQPAPDCPVCDYNGNRPLVIAHQGGDGLWPGDTMYAFEQAVALGVDWLEMDLHVTADGALVLMHDETVDRTTNGSGTIEEMSLDEFKMLDAGYWWTPDDGQTYPYRGQGITPATLEEVFQAFPDMPMNIEIKLVENQPVAQPFCQLIRQYGMQDKVLVASFLQEALDEFRDVCPEVATSATGDEVLNFFVRHFLFAGGTYSPKAVALQVPEYQGSIHVLTPRFVKDAQARNLDVHAWTIDEVEDMERIMALGVDGIITNRPDRLLELLGRQASAD